MRTPPDCQGKSALPVEKRKTVVGSRHTATKGSDRLGDLKFRGLYLLITRGTSQRWAKGKGAESCFTFNQATPPFAALTPVHISFLSTM